MVKTLSSRVSRVAFPPIAEAFSWIDGRQSNRKLLNLSQAVPGYPPAHELQDAIANLAHSPSVSGYTDIFGTLGLRSAYARNLSQDYGADILFQNVGMTSGCNQAFAAAILALAENGDNVIMPNPWYFNHSMWLAMHGVAIKSIPAFSPGFNFPEVEDARAAIDNKTRAIVLCTPNNPTGAVYPAATIAAFYALARDNGIALILDETYKDFRDDAAQSPHQLFRDADWPQTLVQLYSFSKAYAIAGYRLGAIAAGENILHEVAKILDCMTICPSQIIQQAITVGLPQLDDWKSDKRILMAGRLAQMRVAFSHPNLKYELVSSGAYFAYVRHPFGGQATDVAKSLAQKEDVLCLPGTMFGHDQEEYLRFAFANVDGDRMPLLVERLIESQAQTARH